MEGAKGGADLIKAIPKRATVLVDKESLFVAADHKTDINAFIEEFDRTRSRDAMCLDLFKGQGWVEFVFKALLG